MSTDRHRRRDSSGHGRQPDAPAGEAPRSQKQTGRTIVDGASAAAERTWVSVAGGKAQAIA
ncbi:MAG TPA: hypothetical protein VIJ82_14340 [Streptosporangiaceae bacterium]